MTSTDLQALQDFSEALKRAPVVAMDAAAVALTEAASLAREQGVDLIRERYNLDKPYIQKYLVVNDKVKRTDLVARITANHRSVLAPRYGADQLLVPTTSRGKKKGDPYRGIAPGMKDAGSTAWSVLRNGNKKAWANTFFVHLKTSGAWAMVARVGKWTPGMSKKKDWEQNLKVINSLSVAQAWKGVRDEVAPEAMALAQRRFMEELERGL
tara:strand:+ start:88033 stop:88665 length:633 start_codon:yes stop_codon:yes gene_type:complete